MEGTGPVKSTVTWEDDGRPHVGMWFWSAGPKTRYCYQIVSARKINTRDGSEKYALESLRYPAHKMALLPDDAVVFEIRWHKRGRR